ncbi:MAG: response regulator [Bacteroidota bacterium]
MKIKIFLIEDDLDDIEILEYALNKQGVLYEMIYVNDGSAAIDFINSIKQIPDIIILDMNLPKVHGRDVIPVIKASPVFKKIPLVILTTSSAKEDMEYSYKNGADKYLIKPTSVEQIEENVKIIVGLVSK